MSLTEPRGAGTASAQARRVLLGNLVSGGVWIVLLTALTSWQFALLPAAYVVVASGFLAAVYTRQVLTWRQEAMAWTAPWLAAGLLWAWVLDGIDRAAGVPGSVLVLGTGLVLATPCYVAWQFSALAVRQLLQWRESSRDDVGRLPR